MDLYGFWRSQATFRVRVALNLKGIDYREIPVDLDAETQNDNAFRRINPLGSVPALMIDDRPLTQSFAILEYLEETHPEPPILPSDPLGRARVRSLAAIAVADAHPLIVPRVRRYLAGAAGLGAGAWKAWQTHWFTSALQGLETMLASDPETGSFCHGDSPTMADICLVGLAAAAATFEIAVADVPTVDRIADRCRSMEAFAAAAANRQADYPGR